MTAMWTTGLEQQRLAASASALFGGSGLLLALIGTYGVLAYTVSARAREFGIRLALGAERRVVLLDVLQRGAMLAGIGLAVGVGAGLLVNRALAGVATEAAGTPVPCRRRDRRSGHQRAHRVARSGDARDAHRSGRRDEIEEVEFVTLSHAIKCLRRAPGLAIAAVLCLALGAAATSAVTTLVGALLFARCRFPMPIDSSASGSRNRAATRASRCRFPSSRISSRWRAFDAFLGTARVRAVARSAAAPNDSTARVCLRATSSCSGCARTLGGC